MSVIDSWSKEEYLQVMSDTHKTAFGIRPHNTNYNKWSIEDLKNEFLMLHQIIADNEQWEKEIG